MMKLGKAIKQLRLESEISLNELARRSRLSSAFISNLEKGLHRDAGLAAILAISKVLNIKVQDILDRAG